MQNVKLLISREEAKTEFEKRITQGQGIYDTNDVTMDESSFHEMQDRFNLWNEYNIEYLKQCFSDKSLADEYDNGVGRVLRNSASLESRVKDLRDTLRRRLNQLESIKGRLSLYQVVLSKNEHKSTHNAFTAARDIIIQTGQHSSIKTVNRNSNENSRKPRGDSFGMQHFIKKYLSTIIVGGLTILLGAVLVYYASVLLHVNLAQPSISSPTPIIAPSSTQTKQGDIQTPPSKLYREQQGSLGAPTFADPYGSAKQGEKIQPGTWVEVSCKVLAKTIGSASPDGYWYRIASIPWNNNYYAVANTFMNGDRWGGSSNHYTDFSVPDCKT